MLKIDNLVLNRNNKKVDKLSRRLCFRLYKKYIKEYRLI